MIHMYDMLKELFPICRSITGNGVRDTIEIIGKHIPLKVYEYPSGMQCYDWTIPDEWNVTSAWIKDERGRPVVDFKESNLHVLGYSVPVDKKLPLEELKEHIHTDPSRPEVIPYRTSYYERRWGFCMSHKQMLGLKKGMYHAQIRSELKPGSLTAAEAYVPGRSKEEIFFSSYLCHPSLANDSLSGVVLTAKLYEYLKNRRNNHYSYRFLFIPETIGAIAYLSKNEKRVRKNTYCGMVVTCVGDAGPFNYKRTRQGRHPLDRIVENILKHSGHKHKVHDFFLPGSDERQYSSPGFKLPVGSLMRSFYGLPQYHSSADNLKHVTSEALEGSFEVYSKIVEGLEADFTYFNTKPFCEPFLSRYGLYETLGAKMDPKNYIKKTLSVLNFSDGDHSLIDIAEKTGFCITEIAETARMLEGKKLLKRRRFG